MCFFGMFKMLINPAPLPPFKFNRVIYNLKINRTFFYLVGAGLAEPDAVLRVMVLEPLSRLPGVVVLVTDKRAGRGVVPVPVPLMVLVADGLRCGMRDGV